MDENIIWQFLMGRAETLEQTSGEAMEDALAALADTVIFDAETQHAGIIYNNRRVRLQQDGVPKGIRTPVIAVKGRCPRPLDDGDVEANVSIVFGATVDLVEPDGIEPTTSCMPCRRSPS